MSAHTKLHMSPAQAALAANVSRWTIMRAIKSHDLRATRDNRNQWRIAQEDLDSWRLPSVRTPEAPHTPHSPEVEIEIELREKLAAATARADAAEADRDRWQAMAEKLADRPRKGWWLWGR